MAARVRLLRPEGRAGRCAGGVGNWVAIMLVAATLWKSSCSHAVIPAGHGCPPHALTTLSLPT
jgi:hypothetical protein